MVTAVGRLARPSVIPGPDFCGRNSSEVEALAVNLGLRGEVSLAAGIIFVPLPRGLVTFRIRIGIRARIACSIVKAAERSGKVYPKMQKLAGMIKAVWIRARFRTMDNLRTPETKYVSE